MRKIRETFLHFLADNLPTIPIHPVRFDPVDPSASITEIDAVNVTFLDYTTNLGSGSSRVALDIVFSSESAAIDAIETMQSMLSAGCYAPIVDYADTDTPVESGGNIYWDVSGIRFMRVASDQYSHYVCILVLRHT